MLDEAWRRVEAERRLSDLNVMHAAFYSVMAKNGNDILRSTRRELEKMANGQ